MSQLSINNVISIQVSQSQTGIGAYNTSNLGLFTREVAASSFGTLGYKLYLDPSQVAVDFGSNSYTYQMANAVFSQQPNILAGSGYLCVMPMIAGTIGVDNIAWSATPSSGAYVLNYGSQATASLAYNASAAQIQVAINALIGLGQATVTGSYGAGFVITLNGVNGASAGWTLSSNTTGDTITVTHPTPGVVGETLGAAITRTTGLVQYFGVMAEEIASQTDVLAAAAILLPLNKIGFFVDLNVATVGPGGKFDLLRTGTFTNSRGLYYGNGNVIDSLVMMASYAGLALSTNFDGSNTTITMHLKNLNGVQPDSTVTQTILAECQLSGADVYVSIQGTSKTFTSGANSFYDQVYNLEWFVGALSVAGFNYLAQTNTKIPQTENGMSGLKGAYRNICEQGVTCQYLAPGTWTSSTTFGNQTDFINNISQRGYYIYSAPISQQSQASRAARAAPLCQIAAKQAGAIQSSTVIVSVNA